MTPDERRLLDEFAAWLREQPGEFVDLMPENIAAFRVPREALAEALEWSSDGQDVKGLDQ